METGIIWKDGTITYKNRYGAIVTEPFNRLADFNDLRFKKHESNPEGVQAYMEFKNGEWISVIGGAGFYGDGQHTFEMMSSSSEKTQRMVKGWRTIEQISRHMKYLQKK